MTEPLTYTGAAFTPEPGAIVFLPEEPEVGFTEDEAYAFLSGGADAVLALQASLAAAADVHEGAMIAFVPATEDLVELAIDDEDAEPADQLHVTAFYLGAAADIDDDLRGATVAELTNLLQNQPLVVANVFGFAVLNPDGPDPCVVANVGGVDLEDMRGAIEETLADMNFPLPTQHEPWLAHMTLAYGDDPRRWLTDDLMEKTGPISIDRVRIAFGGVVTDIPIGYTLLADAQAFHLPGQHDQSKHGRGGLTAHASTEEGRVAGKLNKGKKLDPKNPQEKRTIDAIGGWSGGSASSGESAEHSAKYFKDEVQYAVRFEPDGDTDGAIFARTVASAPPNAPTLYRGMKDVDAGDIPDVGSEFDLGPTSFTRSRSVMEDFSTPKLRSQTEAHIVRTRVASGSRSLQIDQHTGGFKHEREHVSMGRFRVTSRRETTTTVKIDGEKITVPVTELDIEQIG